MKQFIICPNCGSIELATIEEIVPFWSFIHDCAKCNYCTMESEWNPAKAISIKQPWAYLIASGMKDIENRTWRTNVRGRVLIHTGAKSIPMRNPKDVFTYGQWDKFSVNEKTQLMCTGTSYLPLSNSAIVGSVEIIDCIQNSKSIWAEPNCWHWVLQNPVMFNKPILNVKGKLSFFVPEIPQQ